MGNVTQIDRLTVVLGDERLQRLHALKPSFGLHVGGFEMSVPFGSDLKLTSLDSLGFVSYRTGATFSNLSLGISR